MLKETILTCALVLPAVPFPSAPKHSKISLDSLLAVPGNDSEWEAVRRYAAAVIRSKGWKYNSVDEMAQETCFQLLKSLRAGIKPDNVKGYVSGIVRNVIRTRFEMLKNTDQLKHLEESSPDERVVHPEDWIFDSQIDAVGIEAIRFAISRLKPRWAMLIKMYLESKPRNEIIAELKLTETQYRLEMNRAKMKLIKTSQWRLKNPITRAA